MSTEALNFLNNKINTLKNSPLNFKSQQTLTIPVNDICVINTTTLFSENVDARNCIIDVKVKDSNVNSRTYNLYINSEAICTVATNISTITIFNDFDIDIDILLTIRV